MNILLVASIARFMFAQFVPRLSILLFILNAPLPLLQNDPSGNVDPPLLFELTIDTN